MAICAVVMTVEWNPLEERTDEDCHELMNQLSQTKVVTAGDMGMSLAGTSEGTVVSG